MSDLHMAGGLRFADAGANHFPSFRAWPKTFGDLISSNARFVGHFESSFPWSQSILFGRQTHDITPPVESEAATAHTSTI